MALYESGDRKQCSRCKEIKDRDSNFSKNIPRDSNSEVTYNSRCNKCRADLTNESMARKDARRDKKKAEAKAKKENWYDKF